MQAHGENYAAIDGPIPQAILTRGERLIAQLERNPQSGSAFDELGVFALENNSAVEAIEFFTKAIHLDGPEARYCTHLGEAFAKQGEYVKAAACVAQALADQPENQDLRLALANLQHVCGNLTDAEANYEGVVERNPRHAEAWFNLGVTRTIGQKAALAKQAYERALAVKPMYAEAWNNLALLERSLGDLVQSEACYRRALLVEPDYRESLYNFAVLLQEQERVQEAIVIYERLLGLEPGFAEAHNNLGNSYLKTNRVADAKQHFYEALAANASHKEAPWNLGFASLLTGDYRQGWAGYEHRLAQHEIRRHNWDVPRWNGRFVPGQRILVHHEQGLGDTIQFARYLSLLSEGGLEVDVLCQPALVSLFRRLPCVRRCVSDAGLLSPGDWQAPFPSLGYHFGSRLETLPNEVPYLSVDPERLAEWRNMMMRLPPAKLRAGVVWQGNPNHRNDRNRSLAPGLLAPLRDLDGIQLLSLQKDVDRASLPEGCKDLSPFLTDMMETAAAIKCLDLVISADTAVAHLAGALGKPVWLLVPYAPDWRWLLHREDSPWYPTMRLFRQPIMGDWRSVILEVKRELAQAID